MEAADLKHAMNPDKLRLAQIGSKQELHRHFSTLGPINLAFTITISYTGLSLGLITEMAPELLFMDLFWL
ncbi:hypothetical protein BKA60DRAFT_552582 [Fusarium oxysporum]|nr:hypothetical protein BKA60DRAFT_552582 [Fusarium oxysporum]